MLCNGADVVDNPLKVKKAFVLFIAGVVARGSSGQAAFSAICQSNESRLLKTMNVIQISFPITSALWRHARISLECLGMASDKHPLILAYAHQLEGCYLKILALGNAFLHRNTTPRDVSPFMRH